MRQISVFIWLLAFLFILLPSLSFSEEEGVLAVPKIEEESDPSPFIFRLIPPAMQGTAELTASENVWARFAPQSWARYQTSVVTETESEPIRSLTEVKQTLEEIGDQTYTIQRCVSVQTGAKELVRRPEQIIYNFYDRAYDPGLVSESGPCDNINVNVTLKKLDNSLFRDMGGITRIVPCYVRIFNKQIEDRREETKIWYSPVIFPHLLKQESRVYIMPEDGEGEGTLFRASTTEIWKNAVDLRFGFVKDWMTTMTETDSNGRIRMQVTTLHSSQIPGGILEETSIEYKEDGTLLSRSESRLLDYYVAPR